MQAWQSTSLLYAAAKALHLSLTACSTSEVHQALEGNLAHRVVHLVCGKKGFHNRRQTRTIHNTIIL